MQNDLVPTSEVARLLGKSIATVNRLAQSGQLRPAVEMPGRTGARLYRRSDVIAFLEGKAA